LTIPCHAPAALAFSTRIPHAPLAVCRVIATRTAVVANAVTIDTTQRLFTRMVVAIVTEGYAAT